MEKNYVELKKANPAFPFLIRECSGIEPRVFARYRMYYIPVLGGDQNVMLERDCFQSCGCLQIDTAYLKSVRRHYHPYHRQRSARDQLLDMAVLASL